MRIPGRLILALILVSAVGGCERKRGEIHGVGPYVLGKTKLGEISGACSPDRSQTWCTSLSAVKVGEQSASVDLYFGGHGDNAVLVEVLLAIRACNAESAQSALTHELGKPTEVLDDRLVWTGKFAVIVARLKAEPTVCEVSFVHPLETRTIEYLRTGKMPPKDGAKDPATDGAKAPATDGAKAPADH